MIRYSVRNPVVVIVGIIFLILFGILALKKMPYALSPNIARPVISIYTNLNGATPYEIEKEIINKQEKFLRNLHNLVSISSTSRQSQGIINLEFNLGTDMKQTLLDINSKLSQIKGYPLKVDKPIIRLSGDTTTPSVYLFIESKSTSKPIKQFYAEILESILPLYERLEGSAEVSIAGGVARQIEIIASTSKLAYYNVTIDEIISSLRNANINAQAGVFDYGQKEYRVRTLGVYKSLEDISDTIIKANATFVVRLKDVAKILNSFQIPTTPNIHNNKESISLQIRPTPNANVLDLISKARDLTNSLNKGIIKDMGLEIKWGRDSSTFINQAINVIKQDIFLGIALSSLVLLLFLRSLSFLILTSIIIPISTLGSFIILHLLDRSLNVILLAGVSFAISMIIDSSIVVVENIHRHYKKLGKNIFNACVQGSSEVKGAIFASTLTTIAIFIPILNLKDEAGQLFIDIALASSSSLLISAFVCIYAIPSIYHLFISKLGAKKPNILKPLKPRKGIFTYIDAFFYKAFKLLISLALKNALTRILVIISFLSLSVAISIILFPKLDYLPRGSQNFLISYIQTPNGQSFKEREGIILQMHKLLSPYMEENGYKGTKEIPAIKDFYMQSSPTFTYFYVISSDDKNYRALIPILKKAISSIPNIHASINTQGIFASSSISSSVDVNISGFNLDSIIQDANKFISLSKIYLKDSSIRAVPSLELNNKELNIIPDLRALSINSFSASSFANIIDVIVGGQKVGEFGDEKGKIIDLILKTDNKTNSPEDILYSSIYAPSGKIMPLSSLASLKENDGISQIRHFKQQRSILLIINPSRKQSLQDTLDIIDSKIIPKLELKENKISLSGNANKLKTLANNLLHGFILALLITYLLLSALYGNFIYPLVIIFSVPFGLAGGFLGLYLVNKYIGAQNLDVLGMLGFIILVGSVVNNAILIVYQALINIKSMDKKQAVLLATMERLKPIYMSTFVSVLALMPLVFSSDQGSEIYRGLGGIISGGIFLSSIITIFVIPALLLFIIKKPK